MFIFKNTNFCVFFKNNKLTVSFCVRNRLVSLPHTMADAGKQALYKESEHAKAVRAAYKDPEHGNAVTAA